MGVFLPEPNDEWKATHVYVVKETVTRTFRKVRGSFKLSDGSITKWVMRRGSYWYDHNDKCPENVGLTRIRIKQILEEATVPNQFKSRPSEVLGGPAEVPESTAVPQEEEDEDAEDEGNGEGRSDPDDQQPAGHGPGRSEDDREMGEAPDQHVREAR